MVWVVQFSSKTAVSKNTSTMSTVRGSETRTRPQKHQNRTTFKNDLHDKSTRTKQINSLQVSGVCARCRDKIEWKIKYKKYKPLTAPKKCVRCEQKTVKHAYHVTCIPCARAARACAKCCKTQEEVQIIEASEKNTPAEDAELQAIIKSLPERKRRTLLRFIRKQSEAKNAQASENLEANASTDLLSKKIETLKLSVKNNEDLDGFDFGSEGDSDSDVDEDHDDNESE